MFDKIEISNKSKEYVPYEKTVTVIENRAPTDLSISLLNDFQEKALENLIKTIKVSNNTIDGVVFLFKIDGTRFQRKFVFIFKLNGVEYKIEDNYDIDNTINFSNTLDIDNMANKIVSYISNRIAILLFNSDLEFWKKTLLDK